MPLPAHQALQLIARLDLTCDDDSQTRALARSKIEVLFKPIPFVDTSVLWSPELNRRANFFAARIRSHLVSWRKGKDEKANQPTPGLKDYASAADTRCMTHTQRSEYGMSGRRR